MRADAVVQPYAVDHVRDVGTDCLADVGQCVGEGETGSQIGVVGVFDHLGRSRICHHDLGVETAIQRRHLLGVSLLVCAHDDPVGFHEILDGLPLTQELRM